MIFLERLIYGISCFFAFVAEWLAPRDQKILLLNISKVLKIHSPKDQRKFAREVRISQVRISLETLLFLFFPNVFKFELIEKTPVVFSEKSFLFITGHLGAWEIAGFYARKYSPRPLLILAKPSRSKLVTRILNWVRERLKMQILWLDDPQLFRKMIQTQKAGGGLGFVMDQKPQGRIGPKVDFFGWPTEFVSGPAAMVKKFQSEVFAIFAVRVPGIFKYKVIVEKMTFNEPLDNEVGLTQNMATVIENMIRLYPEQWTWNYKRWKNLEV